MRPNVEINKKMNEVGEISNRIIDIFNQLEKKELDNTYLRELCKKSIFELKDLILQEKKIYDIIAESIEFNQLINNMIKNPHKFRLKFGINENSLSRVLRSMIGYFKNNNQEFDYSVMTKYSEFMSLDFNDENQNLSRIIDALNEEIYFDYLEKNDNKINDTKYSTIRELLIKKKYEVLKKESSTNRIYISTFRPRKSEARLYKVLKELRINFRDLDSIKSAYIEKFFELFFLSNLKILDNEIYEKEVWASVVDKLTIAEVLIGMIDYNSLDKIEGQFYMQAFKVNIKATEINNKIISELIIGLFEQKNNTKRKLKN